MPIPLFLAVPVGFVVFCFLLSVVMPASPARSSQPSPPPAPLDLTDQVRKHDDSDYNKPIIFFDEQATILVFYPNGDIIYRGRKITKDYEVVRALQEILALSPCRRKQ